MKPLSFATVGCGGRGSWLTRAVLAHLPGVTVTAVCDSYPDRTAALADKLSEKGFPRPAAYADYHRLIDEAHPDAVLVSTSWEAHAEVALYAMERGVAVAMEVGGAYSEGECRRLVETGERTGTPFMFMENCCFNKDELLATSLTRNGVFGEVVYCHGAYAHDLRDEISGGDLRRHYRLRNYSTRNCDNYPTHDLGPIARLLNINRGNRMVSLTARASRAAGLKTYIAERPELSYLSTRGFAQGDIVETLITCEGGELISLKLDTTLPRFYSREFTVRGTKGLYMQDNNMVYRDGDKEFFDTVEGMKYFCNNAKDYDRYLPDIWRDTDEETLSRGHGGMDWFEFVAFADALREGRPMPIDVYDAAAWMSITYLTERSIAMGGAPVEIPDFTNGKYRDRKPCDVVPLPVIF